MVGVGGGRRSEACVGEVLLRLSHLPILAGHHSTRRTNELRTVATCVHRG